MTSTHEVYAVCTSNDCKEYFPNNSPDQFTCQVSPPLRCQGQCYVGLKEIFVSFEGIDKGYVIFDVFLAQSTGTILAGNQSSLLKRVMTWKRPNCDHVYICYDICNLVSLTTQTVSRLDVFIKPVFPDNISVLSDPPTSATLMFSNKGVDVQDF